MPSLKTTARRKKSRLLSHSEEKQYRRLVQSLPAAVYMCDAEGYILLHNDAAVTLWGRVPEVEKDKWCGSYQMSRLDGSLLERDQCPMAIALKEGRALREEVFIIRPDGSSSHVLANPQPMIDTLGKAMGAINLILDITDMKRAELELAETKEDLALEVQALKRLHELAMQLSNQMELGPSLQGIVETLVELHSAKFGMLSLYDPETKSLREGASVGFDKESLSRMPHVIPGPKSGACGFSFYTKQRVIVEDTEISPCFEMYRDVARETGFRSVHSTPVLTRTGDILGVLSVHFISPHRPSQRETRFADMCARYAADAIEASQSQQTLRRINNELEERVQERTLQLERQSSRLRTLADQLLSTEQKERKRIAAMLHDHLQQILVASQFQLAEASRKIKQGQLEMINDCLDRGKTFLTEAIRSAKSLSTELRPPVLYESGLIEAFGWLARKFDNDHNLKVTLDLEEIDGDLSDGLKIMLFECVKELFFNVVKHAQVREARLTSKILEDRVLSLEVRDDGAGFHPSMQEKSSDARGLGLFGIRERLKLLNASFDILSKPGKGTRIKITLPLQPSIPQEMPKTNPVPMIKNVTGDQTERIRILLVDDHRLVREGIANILREKPYFEIIAEAENGREAVEKAGLFHPDIAIMDINMPEMNGIEATRLIKRDFPKIQVIGLSVQDENDIADAMKKVGAITLLNKAGDPKDLIQSILDCMHTKTCSDDLTNYPK